VENHSPALILSRRFWMAKK